MTDSPQQARAASIPDAAIEAAAKTCNRCKQEKPLDAYGPDRKGKGGLRGICRTCSNQATKAWRAANPNRHKASESAWRGKNAQYVKQYATDHSRARKAESSKHATRRGRPWSKEDMETLLRDDISLMEISKLLGRTYGAVGAARHAAKQRAERLQIVAGLQERRRG